MFCFNWGFGWSNLWRTSFHFLLHGKDNSLKTRWLGKSWHHNTLSKGACTGYVNCLLSEGNEEKTGVVGKKGSTRLCSISWSRTNSDWSTKPAAPASFQLDLSITLLSAQPFKILTFQLLNFKAGIFKRAPSKSSWRLSHTHRNLRAQQSVETLWHSPPLRNLYSAAAHMQG